MKRPENEDCADDYLEEYCDYLEILVLLYKDIISDLMSNTAEHIKLQRKSNIELENLKKQEARLKELEKQQRDKKWDDRLLSAKCKYHMNRPAVLYKGSELLCDECAALLGGN